jgi:NitT/TauT family transport system substrate-binding protein
MPAINGYVKTKGDIQIISGATNAGAILVSRKDLVVKNLSELANKKIAVPQYGNTQDVSLRYILKQAGLTDKAKGGNVQIIQAENPDIKVLFDQKAIDAALVPEPWATRLVQEEQANIVLDYNQVLLNGNYPSALLIARTDFIKKHPDIVKQFLNTHVDLTDYINNNKDEAKGLINAQIKKYTNKELSQKVINDSFKRLKVTYNPEKPAVSQLIDISIETGFLKQRPDDTNMYSLNILNEVLSAKNKKSI